MLLTAYRELTALISQAQLIAGDTKPQLAPFRGPIPIAAYYIQSAQILFSQTNDGMR
jgi:hypothetical protein